MGMAKELFFLAAIPGAVIFTLALFGVGSSTQELVIPLGWLPRIGPFLMVVLILGVNVRVSYRMIEGINFFLFRQYHGKEGTGVLGVLQALEQRNRSDQGQSKTGSFTRTMGS